MKFFCFRFVAFSAYLTCLSAVSAQNPTLVKDINLIKASSNPRQFVTAGAFMYFTNFDATHGVELWRTDGTEGGTQIVADINPGTASSNPGSLVAVRKGAQDFVYFAADNGSVGRELWRSDGTAAGTVLVKDVEAGTAGSNLEMLTSAPGTTGRAMFVARTSASGLEAWITDGTTEGTLQVGELAAGTASSDPSDIVGSSLGAFAFVADGDGVGRELYIIPPGGMAANLVKDVNTGATSSSPVGLTFYDNEDKIIFQADDGVNGIELWISDGTSGGTSLLKDIVVGASGSFPGDFELVGSTIFFIASSASIGDFELWKTDGSTLGTQIVSDIVPGAAGSTPFALTKFSDTKLIFGAFTAAEGDELYTSDGSSTTRLRDIYLGTKSGLARSGAAPHFRRLGAKAIFFADDGSSGVEPWVSDGSSVGTALLSDVNPGYETSLIDNAPELETLGSVAIFTGLKGLNNSLWKTDGTAAGTTAFKGLDLAATASADPSGLVEATKGVYFAAHAAATGKELYLSDGTSAGTVLVKDLFTNGSSDPSDGVALGTNFFFLGTTATEGRELFKSDGTSTGTALLKDFAPGSASGAARLVKFGSKLILRANDGSSGDELWISDGTAAGTSLLKDIVAGSGSGSPDDFLEVGSLLYFSATDSINGKELWKTDGTPAGTVVVKDIRAGAASSAPDILGVLGSSVFFEANDGSSGAELWKSDGTSAGTVLVKDIRLGASGASLGSEAVVLSSFLYFIASDGSSGSELWRTDGTDAGTSMVKDVNAGAAGSNPSGLVVYNGKLYFAANDGGTVGRELWVTDGTNAGTQLVKDINPGSSSSNPSTPLVADGAIYFSATTATAGTELWKSDGTGAGTVQVSDLYTGSTSSEPSNFLFSKGVLYFAATSSDVGRELRSLVLDACLDDPTKKVVGYCGCGKPETDTDADGMPDCVDTCPTSKIKSAPGACGCTVADVDSNANGVIDCLVVTDFRAQIQGLLKAIKAIKQPKTSSDTAGAARLKAAVADFLKLNKSFISYAKGLSSQLKFKTPRKGQPVLTLAQRLTTLKRTAASLKTAGTVVTALKVSLTKQLKDLSSAVKE